MRSEAAAQVLNCRQAVDDPKQTSNLIGVELLEQGGQEKSTSGVTSVNQILPLVRRRLALTTAGAFAFGVAISFWLYWLEGSMVYFLVGPALLLVGGLQSYFGQYVPISNRHDSLVSKYGDIYVKEFDRAASKHGVGKLITTRWFETYAEDFCKRRANC